MTGSIMIIFPQWSCLSSLTTAGKIKKRESITISLNTIFYFPGIHFDFEQLHNSGHLV